MKVDENIWVDMVIKTVLTAQNDYEVAIIADCRFPNELERWRDFDKEILRIRIDRPGYENKLTEEQRKHSSETSLDNYLNFDLYVHNSGSLETLRENAIQIIENYIN